METTATSTLRLLSSALLVTVGLAVVLWVGRSSTMAAAGGGDRPGPLADRAAGQPAGAAWAQPPAGPTEKATFSMFCYWTGEAALGLVPGVVASRIGHLGGSEIVEVEYDPRRTDPGRLAASLSRHGGFYGLIVADRADRERAEAFLPAGKIEMRAGTPQLIEPKHSLRTRHPELYYLDLTEQQAIALNTWSYFGGRRPDVLTPEQEALLERVRARLAENRGPDLEPERSGPGRERYRRDLLAWLEE